MINVDEIKKNIIKHIQENGPSLPIKVAKAIKMEPVFASAILSELISNHKLKMSKMKVGASQLYLIEGQDEKLESFAEEYFKGVEKQAYMSLKQEKYLIDEDQEPAIRVALRGIKDFATPFRYQEKIMWRYNFTPKEEILNLLSEKSENKKQEIPKKEESKESQLSQEPKHSTDSKSSPASTYKESLLKKVLEPTSESQYKLSQEKQPDLTLSSIPEPQFKKSQELSKDTNNSGDKEKSNRIESKTLFVKPSFESPFNKPKERVNSLDNTKETTPFANEVKSFLEKKHINLVEEIEESRNEFIGIIQINSDLGKIKYLLIARNKKTINDQDIIVAHQKSSEHKMPCYLLHKGKVAKKSIIILEQYSNLIKVQAI